MENEFEIEITKSFYKSVKNFYKLQKINLLKNNPICFLSNQNIGPNMKTICKQINPSFVELANNFLEINPPKQNQDFTIKTHKGHEKLNNLKELKKPQIILSENYQQKFQEYFEKQSNLVLILKSEYDKTL